MKINALSTIAFKNNNHQNKKEEVSSSGFLLPRDEFISTKSHNRKESFIDKFLKLFKIEPKKLTLEEEISEEIDFMVSLTAQQFAKFRKIGKIYYALAKNSLLIGQAEDFRPYCDFDSAKREKLVFGKIDENTNLPIYMTQIGMNEGMRSIRHYEFFDGLNNYKIIDNSNPDIEEEVYMSGKNIISLKEKNAKNNQVQKYVYTKEGFYYYDAEIDNKGKIKQVYSVLNYDTKTYENNEFIHMNPSGGYNIYHLNEEGLWENNAQSDEIYLEE